MCPDQATIKPQRAAETCQKHNFSRQLKRFKTKEKCFTSCFLLFPAALHTQCHTFGQGAGLHHAISGCKVWGHLRQNPGPTFGPQSGRTWNPDSAGFLPRQFQENPSTRDGLLKIPHCPQGHHPKALGNIGYFQEHERLWEAVSCMLTPQVKPAAQTSNRKTFFNPTSLFKVGLGQSFRPIPTNVNDVSYQIIPSQLRDLGLRIGYSRVLYTWEGGGRKPASKQLLCCKAHAQTHFGCRIDYPYQNCTAMGCIWVRVRQLNRLFRGTWKYPRRIEPWLFHCQEQNWTAMPKLNGYGLYLGSGSSQSRRLSASNHFCSIARSKMEQPWSRRIDAGR